MTATGPYEHPCFVCEAPNAPFGFTTPGPSKGRPSDTTLWGCPTYRPEVERINDEQVGRRPAKPDAR